MQNNYFVHPGFNPMMYPGNGNVMTPEMMMYQNQLLYMSSGQGMIDPNTMSLNQMNMNNEEQP